MKLPDRQFISEPADVAASHTTMPLWFALFSPSGGGKTFTALELATGMQSVVGGDINVIDTENGRALHYREFFKFQHTPFTAPYGSLDYLVAINHAVNKGAKVIVVDQLSYEHDGEGGMLDFHEAELDRMAGNDWKKREAVKMLCWTKPKAARKQLIRAMLAMDVAFILCFRADETAKPVKNKETGKNEVLQMGFMPIAGKNFVYEATVSALLLPGAKGVPTWSPENIGERTMVKLPEQFKGLFKDGAPLNREHGRKLAEWARSGAVKRAGGQSQEAPSDLQQRVAKVSTALDSAKSIEDAKKVWNRASAVTSELRLADPMAYEAIATLYESRVMELGEAQKELV